mmetsp:Transcript_59972/g.141432  ORF Transcript_59972/g.141432 Transcript_59972/m.141432 type:complete len:400 (-) Transcript_59972:214-1413(-)
MAAAVLAPSPIELQEDSHFRRHSLQGSEEFAVAMPRNRSFTCVDTSMHCAQPRWRRTGKPSMHRQNSEGHFQLPDLEQVSEDDTDWPRPSIKWEAGKLMLKSLDFDALQFSAEDQMLFVFEIFNQMQVCETLKVKQQALKKFIMCAKGCMRDNHYHNWAHAFDVVQTTYAFALQSGVMELLTQIQRFALIVAALCHDLEHPGLSNQYLIARRDELALRYNDRSVLENHHAFRAFQLMNDETHLLEDFNKEEYFQFRSLVISCVLATDMAKHGGYVTELKQRLQDPEAEISPLFACKLIIKCADISNVTKPFAVAKKWAARITLELFEQGDRERAQGMPVTATCDRERQSPAALQRGFAAFIAIPYFETVEGYLPRLAGLAARIRNNSELWVDGESEAAA